MNMTRLATFFFFLSISVSLARAQVGDRAPHGLATQNPVSVSPSAYDFFHPNAAHQPASSTNADDLCSSTSSKCSPFPLISSAAAQVRATQVHQPALPATSPHSTRVGAGGVAGIVVGLAFAVLLAMGAYYGVVKRRSNSHKVNSPDV